MQLTNLLLALLLPFSPAPQEGSGGPAKTWLQEETVVVPLDLATGHPVVQVFIAGQGPFPMIFDTGASGTLLDADLAESLGIESIGQTRIGDPSNPEANVAELITIPEVSLDGAFFDDLPGIAWDRPTSLGRGPTRGILGLPTFEDCLFTLDYRRAELRISRGELPAPEDDPFVISVHRRDAGLISLPLRMPTGEVVDAHLDSGNANTIFVPARLEAGLDIVEGSRGVQTGMRASGPVEIVTARLSGTLGVGALEIVDPPIRFDAKLGHANVGRSFLERAEVTVDLANQRLRVRPFGLDEAPETGDR